MKVAGVAAVAVDKLDMVNEIAVAVVDDYDVDIGHLSFDFVVVAVVVKGKIVVENNLVDFDMESAC